MLMAILYRDDQILAATRACDQHAMGADYWLKAHPVTLNQADYELNLDAVYETAYISVANLRLRERLLHASIDQSIDLQTLTNELESSVRPSYMPQRRRAA